MKTLSADMINYSSPEDIEAILKKNSLSRSINKIIANIINHKRITKNDAIALYEKAEPGLLSLLADFKNQNLNQNKVYFNKNIHIEPSNVCVYNCRFCSYSRRLGDPDSWVYSIHDIRNFIRKYKDTDITEVHIVGGVYPHWDLKDYKKMIEVVKEEIKNITVKAYTAVEIIYISKKMGISVKDTLMSLQESGLESMPGGGAEIFNEKIRKIICPDKCSSLEWLQVHKQAHLLGIPTNATMLYGHLETYPDRAEHMDKIRNLQDETGGISAFIPLKYRIKNNILNIKKEVPVIEDLKNYAISRLFFDNIRHIKAYWPMIGRQTAKLSLSFGVDDLDGTIDDSTKIYSMAGVEEQKPAITSAEMILMIKESNKIPVERDTFYNELKIYN